MATALLIIIYLTFVSLGLPDSLLGSSFPAIATNLNLPLNTSGYVGMVVSACTILSSLSSGFLPKRIQAKWIISSSVLATALALIAFSFVRAGYGWAFYASAVPLGLGAGAIDSALNSYVALHYKAIHMNWLHASWGVGASIGPLIIGGFIDSTNNSAGWDKGLLTIAFLQLAISALLFLTLPLWNKAFPEEKKEEKAEEGTRLEKKENLFSNPVFYLALGGFFCYCALESATGLWIGNFFHLGMGSSTAEAATLTVTFYIGITVGRFIAGPLSLKWNEKAMIRLGQALICLGIAFALMPFHKFLPIVGFVLTGLGCAPIYPAVIRSTPIASPRRRRKRPWGLRWLEPTAGPFPCLPCSAPSPTRSETTTPSCPSS